MSLYRRNPKRDAVEADIIKALTAPFVGAFVQQLSIKGFPDLLVGWHGNWILLEVKSTKRLRKDQAEQANTIAALRRMGLPVYVVRSATEALQAIGAIH